MTPTTQGHAIAVGLGTNSYDIHIDSDVLGTAQSLVAPIATDRKVVIITDSHVAPLHLAKTEQLFSPMAASVHSLIVPAGEASKSFSSYHNLVEDILGLSIDRQAVLVALGGGVVGDLAGFVAASLLRGIRFIQIPTSLLAQVDSSVGGKTGINSAHGKNLVGAFHQPSLVLADIDLLASLPERELRAGYAEIVKYGLLGDANFFEWLEANGTALLSGAPDILAEAVGRSCQAKADIVAEDEKEQGRRALLNLGHTFAHAFEAEAGYDGRLLHGEAVAVGLRCAFEFSEQLGFASGQDTGRIIAHLRTAGLLSSVHDMPAGWASPDRLISHMYKDKKVQSGSLTFILAHQIGEAFVARNIAEADIRHYLEQL
jgi:3-dehydroquinate synthase